MVILFIASKRDDFKFPNTKLTSICSNIPAGHEYVHISQLNKGNKKITELRTILQRESQNL